MLLNRQRKRRLHLPELRFFTAAALEAVRNLSRASPFPEEVTIVFVSDSRIARIHRDFMSIEGPTDVITFQHGEIFISVETAERQAIGLGNTFDYELRVYIIHGLLHLAGYDDLTEPGFEEMAQLQDDLLRQVERCLLNSSTRLRTGG
jgi:probable rRNA maturation factor